MKLSFALLALLSLSPLAKADLVLPGPQSEKVTVSGADALNLYDALDVQKTVEAALRTSVTTVKVFRSEAGSTQIVCHETVSHLRGKEKTGSCTIEKSTQGKPLPKYKIRRIVG